MSTINTPPLGRKPVRTVVAEASDSIIRQAIVKELHRKGQVFFIHNRVKGIEAVAKKVLQLVPEARVAGGSRADAGTAFGAGDEKIIHARSTCWFRRRLSNPHRYPQCQYIDINRADHFGFRSFTSFAAGRTF